MTTEEWQTVVGVVLLALVAAFVWLLGTFWYVLIPVGVGVLGLFAYRSSPAHKERMAKRLNQSLYNDAVARLGDNAAPGQDAFVQRIMAAITNLHTASTSLQVTIARCVATLYTQETFDPVDIPRPPPLANSVEGARYRDRINTLVQTFDGGVARKSAENAVAHLFSRFLDALPRVSSIGDPLASVPLGQHGDIRRAVDALAGGMFDDAIIEHRLFSALRTQLNRNVYEASGYDLERDDPREDQLTFVTDYRGTENAAELYLKSTPFLPLFNVPVEFRIPEHLRYEHTAIVGGSGHGKTSLLQHLILQDLEKAAHSGSGFAVIDPKGSLIDLIARQACFAPDIGALSERLIVIDPKRDFEHPPSINLFDLGVDDAGIKSAADRMAIRNNALDLIDYMFSDLLRIETTGRQSVSFKYIGDLMLSIPGAHLLTLLDFLEHPKTYASAIAKLEPTARTYLENQFLSERFATTRQGLVERVYGVLQLPLMQAMFAHEKTKVRLSDAINQGKIVLIKADEAFLTTAGASLFGGVWIALLFQAALSRAALPRDARKGFTLYIDEASMFFSEKLRQLLIKAREYKIGAVFAFQDLDQIASTQIRASVMGSTSTKLVGGLNSHDRRALASEMNCSEDFLRTPKKDEARRTTQFAAYIRGLTETPVILSFPLGPMAHTPTMDTQDFNRLIERNRDRVSFPVKAPTQAPKPRTDANTPSSEPTPPVKPEGADNPTSPPDTPEPRQAARKPRSRYRAMDYTPRDHDAD